MTERHKFPPQELMLLPRWIVADKTGKPIPGTAAKDPQHWMNYDSAYAKLQEQPDATRLGFTLFAKPVIAGGRLICIDLDSSIVNGKIQPWAQRIVDQFDSYTEFSPSGTGLHIWVRVGEHSSAADYPGTKHYVDVPFEGAKKPQVQVLGGALEIYASVTGDLIEGVQDRILLVPQDAFDWLRANYPPGATKTEEAKAEAGFERGVDEKRDQEIYDRLPERVRATFESPFAWKERDYPSPSEAYWAVVHAVLHACSRSTERATQFLVSPHAGVWASGTVGDSAEPEKYAKEDWVRNNVERAARDTKGERPDWEAAPSEDEEPGTVDELGLLRPSQFRKRFGGGGSFLIDDFLPRQGVVQIYGKEKHGKSLWAMAIAYAVANPQINTCFGMEVFEHGSVQILVGEDQHGVSGRTRAQELLCKVGESMNMEEIDIWLTEQPGDLTTQEGLNRLAAQLRITKPRLLIVDTQIANAAGIDENKTSDMANLFNNLTKIADQCGCVVLLVHHMAKSGSGGARGSGVQGGAVIADFQATRDGRTVKLTPRHTKNWEPRQQLRGSIVAVEIGTKPNGQPLTAPAIDYRVDLVDVEVDEVEPEQETNVPEPTGGVRPEAELQLWTMLNGPAKRADVAKHMHALGHISTPSVDALKRLERALTEAGKLLVTAKRGAGGGTSYSPV